MIIDLFTRRPVQPESADEYTRRMGHSEAEYAAANKLKAKLDRPKRERKEPVTVAGFRWQPLKQRFAKANVYFDVETQEAYSYGWWRFVERIGPYLVFNSYRYSVSTSKHQCRVGGYGYWREQNDDPKEWGASLLASLGLKIDLWIEAPRGLQDLNSARTEYQFRIENLEAEIAKKGSRKAKNAKRRAEIDRLKIKMATVSMLQKIRDAEDARAEEREASNG